MVVDDARISEYFSDDEEDLIISLTSIQVAEPSTSKWIDTAPGSKDKTNVESKEQEIE